MTNRKAANRRTDHETNGETDRNTNKQKKKRKSTENTNPILSDKNTIFKVKIIKAISESKFQKNILNYRYFCAKQYN